MAYGTLGFGLLPGAFNESTTFVDWDWRSKGYAFGLPLFQREQVLKQLHVVDRLRPIAARHGKSVAQLAISWVLGNPAVTVALVGIRRTGELKEDVAAIEWRLSADERKEIDTPKRASPPIPNPRKSPRPPLRPLSAAGGEQVERPLRLGQQGLPTGSQQSIARQPVAGRMPRAGLESPR